MKTLVTVISGIWVLIVGGEALAEACTPAGGPSKRLSRQQVYAGMPFQAGERATYEAHYVGVKAGYGTLSVGSPRKHGGEWHRVFSADGRTGEWYKMFFVAHDTAQAISRPWDFGVSSFYISQNEGKLGGSRFEQKKWLDFSHGSCSVTEKVERKGKQAEVKNVYFKPGSIDALGAVYYLRTVVFKRGVPVRIPVYTSEKNWVLEAHPVAFEKIQVPAGTFDAVKLMLRTFLGKDLQQKGDVYAWFATKTPQRQLLKLKGEVKIGAVEVTLASFKPGA